ncbi:MAG TPA: T9SS type A sorting domain-containing protein [Bacteroidales bacterium]|nr:T9SS type A sorting domain-containing protein [Bacteroidales bacterium]
METKHLLKKIVLVTACLATSFVTKAVTTATTFAELQSQFAAAVASGVPSTINIGAAISVDADFEMVSTGDTVTLNFVPYGITVKSGTLTFGNKVKVTSGNLTAGCIQADAGGKIVVNAGSNFVSTTGFTVRALAGGTVTVNGGTMTSTATSPLAAAGGNVIINGGTITTTNYPAVASGASIMVSGVATASGGTVTINGGNITTKATGIARGVGIDYNGICIINGGEIHSDLGGGRAVSINSTNAGGKLYVNGGTISALGATGRAIQIDNNNASAWISGSPVITGGLEAIMAQKYGVVVVSGTPTLTGVIGTNSTNAKLYDTRNMGAIIATPSTGYYASTQTVTLSGATGTIYKYVNTTSQASATSVTATLLYTKDGTTPVTTSTAYADPISVAVPSVLTVSPLIDLTTLGTPVVFTYYPTGAPTTAAPTPPVYAAPKVTSIFSDAYTNVANTNFNPGWGQSGSCKVFNSEGGSVLRVSNLNYQGIEFGSDVNALPMNYLHIDVFTPNETSLQLFCISRKTGEKAYQLTPLNLNAWNSFDIPLTAFTSQGLSVADLFQFKLVGSGAKTSYLDNVYFYNSDPTPDAEAPAAFTAVKGLVSSDAVELVLNATDNKGAINYEITYGTTTLKTTGITGVQKSFMVTSLAGSTDYSFSIVAKDPTGNVALNSPIVVTATTLAPLPGAPVPTFDAAKVISIFSDTYTSVAATANYNPGWGQSTVESSVLMSGNNAIKLANLNYQGLDLNKTIDVSSMNKLHIDVYTSDETSLQITPISAGPKEKLVLLTPLNLNAWNSYDLPLSSFTGVDPLSVFQFKLVGSGGKTIYYDNLYFYNDATGIANVVNNSVQCFPTIFDNVLNVVSESPISQIVVRNLIGQTLRTMTVNNREAKINLSDVSAGNYLVTVKLVSGQMKTQKVIKH